MTYSLTLRQPLGRKLTIEEVDNNFLYLQDLASQSGTSSGVAINNGEIPFGTGIGITSSSNFRLNNVPVQLEFGTGNSIIGNLFNSVILGGQSNYICGNGPIGETGIFVGKSNSIANSYHSSIISGRCNVINTSDYTPPIKDV